MIKQKKKASNKLRYMADQINKSMHEGDSDEEIEGNRSVFQEVDYADSKTAQKQIKQENFKSAQRKKHGMVEKRLNTFNDTASRIQSQQMSVRGSEGPLS